MRFCSRQDSSRTLTKRLFIILAICFPLRCDTTAPYLKHIAPKIPHFLRFGPSENDVTTTFNQHVIIHIHVSVNCKRRSIVPIPMPNNNWSISLDEIEGYDNDKSNEASITQSFELDWSSAKGLATISVIASTFPFRPILISLFQGEKLITRRLANSQVIGIDYGTGFEILTLDGIIDECLVDISRIKMYLVNFFVFGFAISFVWHFFTLLTKAFSILFKSDEIEGSNQSIDDFSECERSENVESNPFSSSERQRHINYASDHDFDDNQDEDSMCPPIIFRFKVDPEMSYLQPLWAHATRYASKIEGTDLGRQKVSSILSKQSKGPRTADSCLIPTHHRETQNFVEDTLESEKILNNESRLREKGAKSPCDKIQLDSASIDPKSLRKEQCGESLKLLFESDPLINYRSRIKENDEESKGFDIDFPRHDNFSVENDVSVKHVHNETGFEDNDGLLGLSTRQNHNLENNCPARDRNAIPDNTLIDSAKAVSRVTILFEGHQAHENTACDTEVSSEETTYANKKSVKVAQFCHTATVEMPNDNETNDQVISSARFKTSSEESKESIRVVNSDLITVENAKHEGKCNLDWEDAGSLPTFFLPTDHTHSESSNDNSMSYPSDGRCLTNVTGRVKEIAKMARIDFKEAIEVECGVMDPPRIQEAVDSPIKIDRVLFSCQGSLNMTEDPSLMQPLVPYEKKRKRHYGKQLPSKKSDISYVVKSKDHNIEAKSSSSTVKRKALVAHRNVCHESPENFKSSNSSLQNKFIRHSSQSFQKEISSTPSDLPTILTGGKCKEYQDSACDEFSYVSTLASDIDTSSSTSPPDNESNCTLHPTKDEPSYTWSNVTMRNCRKKNHLATHSKICEGNRAEDIIEFYTLSEPSISKEYATISESQSCQQVHANELRGNEPSKEVSQKHLSEQNNEGSQVSTSGEMSPNLRKISEESHLTKAFIGNKEFRNLIASVLCEGKNHYNNRIQFDNERSIGIQCNNQRDETMSNLDNELFYFAPPRKRKRRIFPCRTVPDVMPSAVVIAKEISTPIWEFEESKVFQTFLN